VPGSVGQRAALLMQSERGRQLCINMLSTWRRSTAGFRLTILGREPRRMGEFKPSVAVPRGNQRPRPRSI